MKYLLILLMLILRNFTFGQEVSRENIPVLPPVHQLRIYEIPTEDKQVFLGRFRDHAIIIMKKHGFTLWLSGIRNQKIKQNLFTCLSGKMKLL
jgi:hypothetical protein